MTRLLVLLLLAGCGVPAVRGVPSAERDDDGRLRALVEGVVPQVLRAAGAARGPTEILVTAGSDPFDGVVAVKLERSLMRLAVTDTAHAFEIGTRGVRFAADTAIVTVQMRHCSNRRGMNYYEETAELRFVEEGPRWRFLRYTAIRHADGACGESARRHLEDGVLDEDP